MDILPYCSLELELGNTFSNCAALSSDRDTLHGNFKFYESFFCSADGRVTRTASIDCGQQTATRVVIQTRAFTNEGQIMESTSSSGTVIGSYKLGESVGKGAYGTVRFSAAKLGCTHFRQHTHERT
jgi:hypothetical protein